MSTRQPGPEALLPLAEHAAARGEAPALRLAGQALSYPELAGVAAHLADSVRGAARAAVWASPTVATCAAVVGALAAGIPVVPINPRAGERELTHVLTDSGADVLLCGPDEALPPALASVPRIEVRLDRTGGALPPEPPPETAAFVVYTSGTTGPPKGAVLPRRAVAANLDALAQAWAWTDADVLVHGLPLFHVHGLIFGVLGPLRRGGALRHLGRFSSAGAAAELTSGATMMFAVPTMYHRLAADAEADAEVTAALRRARLLVSGSAGLPVSDQQRLAAAAGVAVLERYGMTETLIICAARANGTHRSGTVGPPLDGVALRLVDEHGECLDEADADGVGEIEVRGPNLFLGYLNRPVTTAESFHDGWFRTGDVAVRDADGMIRILGRLATDLIKSGGYKIGTGEIENALSEHPDIREAAVTGEPDDDLGERVVAWLVAAGGRRPSESEIAEHVARLLAPHKRPRAVRWLDALPRNELGKIMKRSLAE